VTTQTMECGLSDWRFVDDGDFASFDLDDFAIEELEAFVAPGGGLSYEAKVAIAAVAAIVCAAACAIGEHT
jgi:hypothetical protein